MSDLGRTPPEPGAPPSAVEEQLAADRRALIEETGRGLWPLSRTERALKNQLASSRATQEEGGRIMSAVNRLRTRPRLLSGLIGAALIGGVLLLPISYQRTVGHDVTLDVSTGGQVLPPQRLQALARQLKAAAGADHVQIRLEGDHLQLRASGRSRQRPAVERRTAAIVEALKQQQLAATVQIEPRRERVEARVYAAALAALIDIRVDITGKTDRQVEDEIRSQITASGATPSSVQFQRKPDGTHLEIEAETGGRTVRVIRDHKADTPGSSEVAVKVEPVDDTREPGMTDDQLRDKIKRQLEARGLDATVTVVGDRIEVRAHHRVAP